MVEDACEKLIIFLDKSNNIYGCLMGKLDDYLESFGHTIARINKNLAENGDIIKRRVTFLNYVII